MTRAASAMTKASGASVLASPGWRSAIRRIAGPGRWATGQPLSRDTANGRAPMEAGWSATTKTAPCWACSVPNASWGSGSLWGSRLSTALFQLA